MSGKERGANKLFQRNSPGLYDVVNKPQTKPPIVRYAANSGDLYTITSTTTAGHASEEYAAVCDIIDNETNCNDELQATEAALQIKDPAKSVKPSLKPKPTKAKFPNVSGTGYMNVTEVPTDSGLGVYHVVPWAAMSGGSQPATCDTYTPRISEDDYNALRFKEDRFPQDDQVDNYKHLLPQ